MWFSRKSIEQEALDEAPYIFPYFFDLSKIKLIWRGATLELRTASDPKLTMWSYCYFTVDREILGLMNFWTYFKLISSTSFCCFRRVGEDPSLIRFSLFDTEHLHPVGKLREASSEMKQKDLPFIFNGPRAEFDLSTRLELGIHHVDFPAAFGAIEELAIFATKEGLYPDQPPGTYWSDHILIILQPQKSQVELLALDWFNKSDADFGYVWPTRVARSKRDGRFYGQGIRMANFVLDASGRRLEK
jgi:hypothetical protein